MTGQNVVLSVITCLAVVVATTGCGLGGYASPSTVTSGTPSSASPAAIAPEPHGGSIAAVVQAQTGEDRTFIALASTYLQRVRDNGDPSYLPKAEGLVDAALAKNRSDPDALTLKGMISLSRHQFVEALAWGQRARAANPDTTPSLGVIGDAQIETGQYDAALATFQEMIDQRPDLSSYARVSYLRELRGDIPGAIEAMQAAIEAGGPVPENIAYPTVILGNLYFDSGDLASAEAAYQSALSILPNYVHATAGLAKVQAARKNYSESIRLYQNAVNRYPLPEYVIALGDVQTASGDLKGASASYDLAAVEQKLYQANGIDVDAELALFQADHQRDLPTALDAAQRAIKDRNSVGSADVLSWTLYQLGRYDEALTFAHQAERIGTRSALFSFHQGMIEYRLGQLTAARADLERALTINPYFSPIHGQEARDLLAAMGGSVTPANSGESSGQGPAGVLK